MTSEERYMKILRRNKEELDNKNIRKEEKGKEVSNE